MVTSISCSRSESMSREEIISVSSATSSAEEDECIVVAGGVSPDSWCVRVLVHMCIYTFHLF